MFLILFGWGRITMDDEGEVVPGRCPHCHNEVYWHLVHARKWFNIFLVPVFSYASVHTLTCPVCTESCGVETAEGLHLARRMVAMTEAFRHDELSVPEYMRCVKDANLL